MASENQTSVETAQPVKLDLNKIREEVDLGVTLDVALHRALQDALDKDQRAH